MTVPTLLCSAPILRAARIAHRDLRLANVVDVDGQPWIVDFGFAQAVASADWRMTWPSS